ncbi:MAG: hypothetical protein AAGA58_20335 [Verrucomicrobiota bacterium]
MNNEMTLNTAVLLEEKAAPTQEKRIADMFLVAQFSFLFSACYCLASFIG